MATIWVRDAQGVLRQEGADQPAKLSGVQMTVLAAVDKMHDIPAGMARTFNVMHKRGLIAETPPGWSLTAAGKAALNAYKGEKPDWVPPRAAYGGPDGPGLPVEDEAQVPEAQPPVESPAQANVSERPGKEERAARAAKAAELRAQGFTYTEIATALGLPNCGVAHRLVKQAGAK